MQDSLFSTIPILPETFSQFLTVREFAFGVLFLSGSTILGLFLFPLVIRFFKYNVGTIPCNICGTRIKKQQASAPAESAAMLFMGECL